MVFKRVYYAFIGIILCILVYFIISNDYKTVIVDGESMMGNFNNGDLLLISEPKTVKQGDVIIFWNDRLNRYLIKRIVAVQGDLVEYTSKEVYVNDKKLDDSYVYNLPAVVYAKAKPELVKDDCVYVLGDNRANSLDSRFKEIGEIPIENISGVVVLNISAYCNLSARTIKSILNTLLCVILTLYFLNINTYSNSKSAVDDED